jgi:hypothetical protein
MREYPTALTPDVVAALAAPFPLDLVEVKPGATTKDKTRALALAYVEWRAYARRLDEVVGPTNWSFRFIPWGPTRIIAELTIFGVTKTATGEGAANDENCGTIAEAQAKKRACSEFSLGRYLYDLPNDRWFDYDADKKRFVDPAAAAAALYRAAGLVPSGPLRATDQPVSRPPVTAQPHPTPPRPADPAQQSRARAALDQAERRTGVAPATERSTTRPTAPVAAPSMATKAQVRQLMQGGPEAQALAEGRFNKSRFYDLTVAEAETLIRQLNA